MAQTDMAADGVMRSADGTPLKVSLARALRRRKITALLLVAPLFIFILFTFLIPIVDMTFRSVENSLLSEVLPRTVAELDAWDETSGELPPEPVYAAMFEDVQEGAKARTIGRVGTRLNYESAGMSSLFRASGRKFKRLEGPPYKEAMIGIDKKWGDVDVWRLIKRESAPYTLSYYLAAVDMRYNNEGEIQAQPEDRQIYINLFIRTLWLSLLITVLCIVLGYPISYLLATLPTATSNLLMIMVLLPFWTSLLVRTTSWIVLLQSAGVLNELLVAFRIVAEDARPQLIHNRIGTIIAMTHILLPFMVLPLYSVMKTIPPSYMRAAMSLGANPVLAFIRVYVPQTIPGIGAGSILVFILAIGYYITPALVGGTSGTLIGNFIAYHMQVSLNWGLAAALGAILLSAVLILYWLYNRIVGIDNMKLG